MNIIVFTKRRGHSSQFELTRGANLIKAALGVAVVAGGIFLSGFLYAAKQIEVSPDHRIVDLESTIDDQRREIDMARAEARNNVDALAARIGQMQAHVIRLDALGRRLTQMADLEQSEFNFETAPPQGGPELKLRGEISADEFLAGLDDLSLQLKDREKQLSVLENLLLNRNLDEQVYPAGRPVEKGWISSFYGTRIDPFTGKRARHDGVDFAGRAGTPIIAVGAGVVTWSAKRFGYGNMVEISHGNGYATRYAHNQANLVAVGDKVEKGQVIALMGATGRATGPNLHFEVISRGATVDPLKYIQAHTH